MSNRINPSTYQCPIDTTGPEPEETPRAGATSQASPSRTEHGDSISKWDPQRAAAEREFATRELSPGEKFLSDQVKTMGEGDVATAELSAKLKALLELEGSACARIELLPEGTYKVRVVSSGAVGAAEGNFDDIALTGRAAYTFILQTPEGVADLLQGVSQRALLEVIGGSNGLMSPFAPRDLRLRRYAAVNTESMAVEAGVRGSLGKKGAADGEGMPFAMTFAKAGVEIEGAVGAEFNPNTRELTLEAKIEAKAAAKFMMPVVNAAGVGGKAKVEAKARARITVSEDEARELVDGRTSLGEMTARLAKRAKYDVVVGAEVALDAHAAIAGLAGDLKLHGTMAPGEFVRLSNNPLEALSPDIHWDARLYTAKETGVGSPGFDFEIVEAKVDWKMYRLKAHHSGSLPEIIGELSQAKPPVDSTDIQARAAIANLSK